MKKFLIILCLLMIAGGLAFALSPHRDNKKVPPVALPDAYRIAVAALGSATNEFHCTAAVFEVLDCPNGEWTFAFYTTNEVRKAIHVCVDGSTVIENGTQSY